MNGQFNIRVYGIYIEDGCVLVSDEIFNGIRMTKFPGGGLHYGEGTIDCLRREVMEEFHCNIEVLGHFYTTDYYQPALFFKDMQLVSIYYFIRIPDLKGVAVSQKAFRATLENPQQLRWVPIDSVNPKHFTFPVDQKVAVMIKDSCFC